jgi:hypothetical protein
MGVHFSFKASVIFVASVLSFCILVCLESDVLH